MINKILKVVGADKAIIYTITGRVIQAVGGLILIGLISLFLTPVEQGYFYTFSSILALQQFFELGMTGIITQYVAHEKVFLKWNFIDYSLEGNVQYKSRLSSILKLTVKWFSVMCIILFVTLCLAGYIFFSYYTTPSKVNWQMPWYFASFATSITLFVIALLAFYEGLGKIKEVALIRMIQQIVQIITTISIFYFGGKLYAIGVAMFASSITGLGLLRLREFRLIFKNIWNEIGEFKVVWKTEIFPYQWRIALSWMSGYFIFQLFNPAIFAFEGAKAAGQFGMTMALLNGVLSIPMSWINTKISTFSSFIAERKFYRLDALFFKTLKQSVSIFLLGCVCILSIRFFILIYRPIILERFVITVPFLMLMLTSIFQLINNALATYLRCHKKEPYLLLSIVMGFTVGMAVIVVGRNSGVLGITVSYCIISFIGLILGLNIFIKKRKQWHQIK